MWTLHYEVPDSPPIVWSIAQGYKYPAWRYENTPGLVPVVFKDKTEIEKFLHGCHGAYNRFKVRLVNNG